MSVFSWGCWLALFLQPADGARPLPDPRSTSLHVEAVRRKVLPAAEAERPLQRADADPPKARSASRAEAEASPAVTRQHVSAAPRLMAGAARTEASAVQQAATRVATTAQVDLRPPPHHARAKDKETPESVEREKRSSEEARSSERGAEGRSSEEARSDDREEAQGDSEKRSKAEEGRGREKGSREEEEGRGEERRKRDEEGERVGEREREGEGERKEETRKDEGRKEEGENEDTEKGRGERENDERDDTEKKETSKLGVENEAAAEEDERRGYKERSSGSREIEQHQHSERWGKYFGNCSEVTGGSCYAFPCHRSRGDTVCRWNKCVCAQRGMCVINGMCVSKFKVGRDDETLKQIEKYAELQEQAYSVWYERQWKFGLGGCLVGGLMGGAFGFKVGGDVSSTISGTLVGCIVSGATTVVAHTVLGDVEDVKPPHRLGSKGLASKEPEGPSAARRAKAKVMLILNSGGLRPICFGLITGIVLMGIIGAALGGCKWGVFMALSGGVLGIMLGYYANQVFMEHELLWPQWSPDHSSCFAAAFSKETVPNQRTCQENAISLGDTYYQYNPDNMMCATTSRCDLQSGTTDHWKIFTLQEQTVVEALASCKSIFWTDFLRNHVDKIFAINFFWIMVVVFAVSVQWMNAETLMILRGQWTRARRAEFWGGDKPDTSRKFFQSAQFPEEGRAVQQLDAHFDVDVNDGNDDRHDLHSSDFSSLKEHVRFLLESPPSQAVRLSYSDFVDQVSVRVPTKIAEKMKHRRNKELVRYMIYEEIIHIREERDGDAGVFLQQLLEDQDLKAHEETYMRVDHALGGGRLEYEAYKLFANKSREHVRTACQLIAERQQAEIELKRLIEQQTEKVNQLIANEKKLLSQGFSKEEATSEIAAAIGVRAEDLDPHRSEVSLIIEEEWHRALSSELRTTDSISADMKKTIMTESLSLIHAQNAKYHQSRDLLRSMYGTGDLQNKIRTLIQERKALTPSSMYSQLEAMLGMGYGSCLSAKEQIERAIRTEMHRFPEDQTSHLTYVKNFIKSCHSRISKAQQRKVACMKMRRISLAIKECGSLGVDQRNVDGLVAVFQRGDAQHVNVVPRQDFLQIYKEYLGIDSEEEQTWIINWLCDVPVESYLAHVQVDYRDFCDQIIYFETTGRVVLPMWVITYEHMEIITRITRPPEPVYSEEIIIYRRMTEEERALKYTPEQRIALEKVISETVSRHEIHVKHYEEVIRSVKEPDLPPPDRHPDDLQPLLDEIEEQHRMRAVLIQQSRVRRDQVLMELASVLEETYERHVEVIQLRQRQIGEREWTRAEVEQGGPTSHETAGSVPQLRLPQQGGSSSSGLRGDVLPPKPGGGSSNGSQRGDG